MSFSNRNSYRKHLNIAPFSTNPSISYIGDFFSPTDPTGFHSLLQQPSTSSHVSVDVVSQLSLSVLKYTGGDHGPCYDINNLISASNRAYCAKHNHCSVVLKVGADSFPTSCDSCMPPLISEINIVAPTPASYTSPVQNVAIFMAMDYTPDIIDRTDQYINNSQVTHLFGSCRHPAPTGFSLSQNNSSTSRLSSVTNSRSSSSYSTPLSSQIPNMNAGVIDTVQFQLFLRRVMEQRIATESRVSDPPPNRSSDSGDPSTLPRNDSASSLEGMHTPISVRNLASDQIRENISLFKKELDQKLRACRPRQGPIIELVDDSNNNHNSTQNEKERSVRVHYTFGTPKYRTDPITCAQELDLVKRHLRLRQCDFDQQHGVKAKKQKTKFRGSTRFQQRSHLRSDNNSRTSHETGEIEVTRTAYNDGPIPIDMDTLEDSKSDTYSSDSDFENDTNFDNSIPFSSNRGNLAGGNKDIENYSIDTALSNTQWESSGPLHPIALASIPNRSSGEKRHLNIKFSQGVMARYLVFKFSNTATKGSSNVDVESITVHGIESGGSCVQMI